MEHLTRWQRIAVATDVELIKYAVRFFSFLMPSTTKLISQSDAARGVQMDRQHELSDPDACWA
jgi:hypothetical protein